jgi:peptidyl-tRNA hydrolase
VSPVLHDGVAHVDPSEGDPLIMYMVIPRRPAVVAGQLLADAAVATVECVRYHEHLEPWAQAFADWRRGSFRKVCLGARGVELTGVRTLSHATRGEVLCLPPRRRSTAEPELAALRAHAGGPLRTSPWPTPPPPEEAMVMLVAQELGLTLGKACAQLGHAVLLGRDVHARGAIVGWERAGAPVAVRLVERATFDRARQALTVAAVRDAGLTQVPAGTETVLATAPGARLPGWLCDAARGVT